MLGKVSKDHRKLPPTPCITPPLHLVVLSATLPPASPDPADIAPETHTHTPVCCFHILDEDED